MADTFTLPDGFEIYRPDRISSRLEPTYKPPPEDEWRPSLHYKHPLRDIKNQFTPAEYFRHRLKTSGAHFRKIQRLELRWSRRYDEFTAAAIKVQALYRGIQGRIRYRQIKEANYDSLLRRRLTPPARDAFIRGDYEMCISFIVQAPVPWGEELHTLHVKSLYRLQRYSDCFEACTRLHVEIPQSATAWYFQSCALAQQSRVKEAYEVIREGSIRLSFVPDDVFRLTAGLATEQHPPEFEVAIDSFSELVRRNPKDFESFLGRAACYSCLQEWTEALVDIQQILAFQPGHRRAILLRARIYGCNRRWDEAAKDYRSILFFEPNHVEASEGLKQVQGCKDGEVLTVED